jgi:hypothetical protein
MVKLHVLTLRIYILVCGKIAVIDRIYKVTKYSKSFQKRVYWQFFKLRIYNLVVI